MSYNTVVKDLETDNIIDKNDSNNGKKNISNKNLMDQTVKLKPKENDDIEKTKTEILEHKISSEKKLIEKNITIKE